MIEVNQKTQEVVEVTMKKDGCRVLGKPRSKGETFSVPTKTAEKLKAKGLA